MDVNSLRILSQGTGTTTLSGAITTDDGADLSIATDVELIEDITFTNTESGVVDLTGGAVDSAAGNNLTIAANATNIAFGAIGQEGANSTFGAITASTTGALTLEGNISTAGGKATAAAGLTGSFVDFRAARQVQLLANVDINTSRDELNAAATGLGADIRFASATADNNSLGGTYNLRMDAGQFGDITINNVTELTLFQVLDLEGVGATDGANSVVQPSGILAIPGIVNIQATTSIVISNAIIDDDVFQQAARIEINDGIVVTGNHSIQLIATGIGDANNDGATNGDDVAAGDIVIGSFVASTTGNITLTADDDVVFLNGTNGDNGVVNTLGDVTITANSGADEAGRGILELNGDADTFADILGSTITLSAVAGFIGHGTIVAASDVSTQVAGNLEIDAINQLDATTNGAGTDTGDINVQDVNDLLVGLVDADEGDVDISALRSLNDADTSADATVDITGDNIDLDAGLGIGNVSRLELQLDGDNNNGEDISADSTSGDINLINIAAPLATLVTTLTTGIGNINFEQTGNVALTVNVSSTSDGNISITNTGNVAADDLLTLVTITAGGDGNIDATTTTAGNIVVTGPMTAIDDQITLTSANGVTIANSGINATGGTATVIANDGNITSAAADGTPEIVASDIVLTATGTIGTGAVALETETTGSSITFTAGTSYNNINDTLVTTTLTGTAGTTVTFLQRDNDGNTSDVTGTQEVLSVETTAGDINITVDEGDLITREVIAGTDGDIFLTTTHLSHHHQYRRFHQPVQGYRPGHHPGRWRRCFRDGHRFCHQFERPAQH